MGLGHPQHRLLALSVALLAVGAGCETGRSPSTLGPSSLAEPGRTSTGPFTVSGIVTSGGQPVADAVVIGFRASGNPPLLWPNAQTGPDGRFQFTAVWPGGVSFYPLKRDYLHPCLTTPVSKDVELELELVKLPALRPVHVVPQVLTGTVIDPSGKPVADAFVTGWLLGDFPELETRTDATGRYLLCGLGEEFFRRGSLTVGGVVSPGFEAIHVFSQHGSPTPLGDGELVLDLRIQH